MQTSTSPVKQVKIARGKNSKYSQCTFVCICYLALSYDSIPLKKLLHYNLLTLTGNLNTHRDTNTILISTCKCATVTTFCCLRVKKSCNHVLQINKCVCVFMWQCAIGPQCEKFTHNHVCHQIIFQSQLNTIPEKMVVINQRRSPQLDRQTSQQNFMWTDTCRVR